MRSLDSAIAAQSILPVVRRIYFVRLEFDGGTIAWHSGFGDIIFDGHTYNGGGNFGSISSVKEAAGVKSAFVSVKVTGIKPEIISLAQTEPYINRKAYIHMTMLDESDVPLIATPMLVFKGSIDAINGTLGKDASFDISIKSRLADWERPRKIRYSDADQQKVHPGDKFFEFVPQLSQRKLVWPRAAFLPDPRD